jgi:hypothetical protein
MNSSAFQLLASASITLVSIIVGALSYRALEREDLTHAFSLGALSSIPTRYNVVDATNPERCLGAFSVSAMPAANQTTLDLRGWVLVGLNERVQQVHLEATMICNALGQLSVSLFRADYGNESIRLGTIGVNPITLQAYRGQDSGKPLLSYPIPGPVVLSLRNGIYQVSLPPRSTLPSIPAHGLSRFPISLSVVAASPERSCNTETARPIDLGPVLRLAESLNQAIPVGIPGL